MCSAISPDGANRSRYSSKASRVNRCTGIASELNTSVTNRS